MNLLLAILLGTGAVIGTLGMLAMIAGGVAAALIDADSGSRGVIDTAVRPVVVRPSGSDVARPSTPLAA